MIVSISLVLLLGAAVLIMIRYTGLRVWQALVCMLLGFYLAATAAAPQIRRAVAAVLAWLT